MTDSDLIGKLTNPKIIFQFKISLSSNSFANIKQTEKSLFKTIRFSVLLLVH